MSLSEYLERFYSVFPWREDPFTEEVLRRFHESLRTFQVIIEHSWVKELLSSKSVLRIIDLCSSTGIGGIVLSRTLLNLGYSAELTLVDLRKSALEKSIEFSLGELGFKPKMLIADVIRELGFERDFDVALIWDLTTLHFNPLNWVRVLVNVSIILRDNGLLLYDEVDRHSLFIEGDYEKIHLVEVGEDRIILDIHVSKECKSGFTRKIIVDLVPGKRVKLHKYIPSGI